MSANTFVSITSEGGMLPSDFLQELTAPGTSIEGLTPASYHLAEGERISEQVNRSWNRLKGCWANFRKATADKKPGESTTTETRERWLQPLFQELGYGQKLPSSKPIEIDGRAYPISHGWGNVPLHLVGSHVDIDRRTPGAVGAAKASPHSLVQQTLNASSQHLWGMVSNGLVLRLLRDNVTLTRMAYVEWDLAAMFDGDLYSEFFLLWLLCHQSRFEGERSDQCWLEKWKKEAADKSFRALEDLRPGVESAISSLGAGLVSNPANKELLAKLRTGELSTQEFYRQILRVVYRMIFLFAAEDRGLLHPPLSENDSEAETAALKARQRYRDFYSLSRLRKRSMHRTGTPHPDLWTSFQLITQKLGSDNGCPELALPPLGSFLWQSDRSTPDLDGCLVSNRHFLFAVQSLAFVKSGGVRRSVDYRNLGAEEIGAVYEGLLELHPRVNAELGTFELETAAGNERKTSGSYYTPDSLVQCLLDTALDPVVDQAVAGKSGEEAAQAILKLKVCDPAVGSGHFLIAAAHRMARRLAAARTGEEEPSPEANRAALRDVIGHCLYGVDINPMSAELCRVSLWLEALEPGKPLSFLDHHIRVGNSLLGTTPELVAAGIPDDAFTAIEGDEKAACTALKRRNARERQGHGDLFAQEDLRVMDKLRTAAGVLESLPDDSAEAVRKKEKAFRQARQSHDYLARRTLFDAWCAAFVIKKVTPSGSSEPEGITTRILNTLADGGSIPDGLRTEIQRLAKHYQFFHFPLELPEVFANGGFDVILGNPPWEQLEQQSSERIDETTFGAQHLIEHSAKYPYTGSGRKNLYGLFAELAVNHLSSEGRVGLIVPTGMLQDLPASNLAASLMEKQRLVSAYDFENRRKGMDGKKWFSAAHPQQRFCLITIATAHPKCRFVFDVTDFADLCQADRYYFQSFKEVTAFCESVFKVPMFRQAADARIATEAHKKGVMLGNLMRGPNPELVAGLVFNAEAEVKRQKVAAVNALEIDGLARVYEGAYIHQFDHRFATFQNATDRYLTADEKCDPKRLTVTESYLPLAVVNNRLKALSGYEPRWVLVLRRQARATDSFISISCIIPLAAAEGNLSAFFFNSSQAERAGLLCAEFNSFTFNFLTRLRQSGANLNKNVYSQLPVVDDPVSTILLSSLGTSSLRKWVSQRVIELTYTAWDVEAFAKDCDFNGPPFRWNEDRRFFLRCELDAAFFHLYGLNRDDTAYVMDTFPIVKRKDEEKYGTYRTKDTILEIYDELQAAMDSKQPYQTRLDPPPADSRCCHPARV